MKVTLYTPDGVVDDPPEPLPALLARPQAAVWVDLTGPTRDDLAVLRDVFQFHPLAIEDTRKQEQRPKIDEYDGYFFVTVHAVRQGGDVADVALEEIDLFFGHNYVVTSHRAPSAIIAEARQRLNHAPPALRPYADYLFYTVVDVVVDSYFPTIDALDDALDALEDRLFARPGAADLDRLFRLKRALLAMRRVAAPMRDMFNALTRRDLPVVRPQTLAYLRDVFDHLLRVTDMIDAHRDLLAGAMDLYLSVVNNQLNEVMKRLTAITAAFALAAFVTGFYGMNFDRTLPPFAAPYGAAAALALIVALVVLMVATFRRLGWI